MILLQNKPLSAETKFKMNEWNPPNGSFETLDEYDEVCVPGNTCKSVKKLILFAS